MTTPEPHPHTPCCPQLEPCEPCDRLNTTYRLPYKAVVGNQTIPVEVTLHYVLERCPGPLATGPLVYTTTLLPGETVRVATSDRHSSFSYDSSSTLSYRHRASSEESFYTAGMAQSLSDISIVDSTRSRSQYHESAVSGGGGAGLDLGFFEIGGSVNASSFDASSFAQITRNFTQHARSSHFHTESGVRAASSVSVGSVATRTHTEGQSQDHYESSSRTFHNPNQCRALTFLFHQIVKCQKVSWRLDKITRRVIDDAAPTGVTLAAPKPITGVTITPQTVVATSAEGLKAEMTARDAAALRESPTRQSQGLLAIDRASRFVVVIAPIPEDVKAKALADVDAQLMRAGLINDNGDITEEARLANSREHTLTLPTPGVQVRTCKDECNSCEPELHRKIMLDLEYQELVNKRLAREIELMDRDSDHRDCCLEEEGSIPPSTHPV
jgi:hypothetical protein